MTRQKPKKTLTRQHSTRLVKGRVKEAPVSLHAQKTCQNNALVELVERFRREAGRRLDRERRTELCQFMTPSPVACFMARMFRRSHRSSLGLLDPGAGVGTLLAAFVAEVCGREERPSDLSITAYEIDPAFAKYLEATLEACRTACESVGVRFTGEVVQEDFIKAGVSMLRGDLFSTARKKFDCAILNPPYMKIHSSSVHRRLLRSIDIETGNLYTAFLAITQELLSAGGEVVAITPRSFCNGPYFKPFRKSFLEKMTLRCIHVFESRNSAFKEDGVLQENVIFHASKSTRKPETVTTSSSSGPGDGYLTVRKVAYDQVVQPGDPDAFIHIVKDDLGYQSAAHMKRFTASLEALGLKVSTGRVVDFRARDFLCFTPGVGTVPLIYPGHFAKGFVTWPLSKGKKPNALLDAPETQRLLVPVGIYLLIKRFSAKEEPRRVVAAIYDPSRVAVTPVGFENHLNYYHCNGKGLPENLAKGLAAFLNSTLVDAYFRLFNGHTQVNATDLRSLKYPSRAKLETLGRKIGNTFPEQNELDRLVERELLLALDDTSPQSEPVEVKDSVRANRRTFKAVRYAKNVT